MRMLVQNNRWFVLAALVGAVLGFAAGFHARRAQSALLALIQPQGRDSPTQSWPDAFSEIRISSAEGGAQRAWYLAARGETARPLLVSLHTWSGDYTQQDPLADLAAGAGWNYIHPDFGGRNDQPGACLSNQAMTSLDEAIDFAIRSGPVDPDRIFVAGMSGGGYAALGLYLRTRHRIHTYQTWVPISDLSAWYFQSRARGLNYARDIARCTTADGVFSSEAAMARSPLHWRIEGLPTSRLEIYAGIRDGHEGSVPISHSIHFFNKMAVQLGFSGSIVSPETTVALLTRAVDLAVHPANTIDDRSVVYSSAAGPVSITIFEGGHEMLPVYAFSRLQELAAREGPRR
jgi:acetyl esterase/lipase